jgi:ribosomal protein S18 acetylase RimI-like enzyme
MAVIIREASPDDVDVIRDVQRRTWLATYPNEALGITREDIETRFREAPETARARRERRWWALCTPPHHSWVALEEDVVIGFCIASQDERENLIEALYVLPGYQGRGVGRRLLQTALDWFGEGHEVALNVASYNEKAIAFYRASGFVSAGPAPLEETVQLASGVRLPEIRMVRRGA